LKSVADVLLSVDAQCREDAIQYLASQHGSGVAARQEAAKQFHSFLVKNPQYFKKMPLTPAQTVAKLKRIEEMYAGAVSRKKSIRGRPLFTAKARKAWKETIELVMNGHHGLPPGVARYLCVGRCKKTGLRIFQCMAGTSWVESWHNYQRDCVPPGVGIIYGDIMLHHRVDR
jgi:hypothetical protein